MSAARVLEGTGRLSQLDQEELNVRLEDVRPTPTEVGPTFHRTFSSSKRQAVRLAEGFATTLPELDHHRQLFQAIAPAFRGRTQDAHSGL